jgi:anti-sigma B factor antagonist
VSDVLRLHVDHEGETVFARLAGELDIAAEAPLDKLFGQLCAEAGTSSLVVDMRRVSFLDSSGLRILLKQEMRSRRDGFDFALILPRGPALRALQLAGLHRLIQIRTASGTKVGEGAQAAERASAGLGTADSDPGDWLSQSEPGPDGDAPMEIP